MADNTYAEAWRVRPSTLSPSPKARGPLVLGLDEAGRGAVLGPLVVAGVVLTPAKAEKLTELGVCDSKLLTRTQRAKQAQDIRRLAERMEVQVRTAAEVDTAVDLDRLERQAADEILKKVGPIGRVVADGRQLFEPLGSQYPDVHFKAVDHGEALDVAVAAASVIAKDCRDQRFDCIMKRYAPDYGELKGGGYGGEHTERFLRAYFRRNSKLPPETRLSSKWKVIRELVSRQIRGKPSLVVEPLSHSTVSERIQQNKRPEV